MWLFFFYFFYKRQDLSFIFLHILLGFSSTAISLVSFENTQQVAPPPTITPGVGVGGGRKVGSRPLNRASKTLKQIGRSSRRAHRVALPSARSRENGLDFARSSRNWTTSFRKKKKKTSADRRSHDLCRDFQIGVRIQKNNPKNRKSFDPVPLVSAAQAAAGGVDVFLALLAPLCANRAPVSPLHWEDGAELLCSSGCSTLWSTLLVLSLERGTSVKLLDTFDI